MSMFQQHTTCDAYTQTLIPIVVLHFFSSSSSWWFFPIYFHHSSISFLFISMGIARITTLVGFSSLCKVHVQEEWIQRSGYRERGKKGLKREIIDWRKTKRQAESTCAHNHILSVFGSTHSYSAAVSDERVAAATASSEDRCWPSSVKREEMSGEKQWSHGNDRKRKWEGKISKRNRLATSKFYHSRSLFGPDEEQKVSERKMNNSCEWTRACLHPLPFSPLLFSSHCNSLPFSISSGGTTIWTIHLTSLSTICSLFQKSVLTNSWNILPRILPSLST